MWLIDVDWPVTRTNYFLARRVGGSPAAFGWEPQGVVLAPMALLPELLTAPSDQHILQALRAAL